ncbi:hypothetical protein GCK72_017050 [Caenorhabditis remanei]|uniref:Uncharacterized protein n=1 Tax=Caenorhabditis remanei TaxID=31234 RepID=A0A6A5G683_CAERE|nr:hypothetical protein GCK72_017050 [Caenorhabditis remanei]KAF1750500.1 hypothetical protein GCK72_017050 [Caenorhabditis remanei]
MDGSGLVEKRRTTTTATEIRMARGHWTGECDDCKVDGSRVVEEEERLQRRLKLGWLEMEGRWRRRRSKIGWLGIGGEEKNNDNID